MKVMTFWDAGWHDEGDQQCQQCLQLGSCQLAWLFYSRCIDCDVLPWRDSSSVVRGCNVTLCSRELLCQRVDAHLHLISSPCWACSIILASSASCTVQRLQAFLQAFFQHLCNSTCNCFKKASNFGLCHHSLQCLSASVCHLPNCSLGISSLKDIGNLCVIVLRRKLLVFLG